jgi:hypothetical protein
MSRFEDIENAGLRVLIDDTGQIMRAVDQHGRSVWVNTEAAVTESAHLAMHGTLRLPNWPTWGTATPQVWRLSADDTIEATATNALLITTSNISHKSGIGRVERPLGAAGTNSDRSAGADATKGLPWSDDSGYMSGAANVCTIVGGYDHVNNQIAGTIVGGGHNYIQYNIDGHSIIAGGSNQRIAAGRGGIFAGLNNTLTSTATLSVVCGGSGNTISGSYGAVLGGYENIVSGNSGSVAVGGNTNSAGGVTSAIIGGANSTITPGATGSVIAGGSGNTVGAGASYCIVSGRGNSVSHTLAAVFGRDATSDLDGCITLGKTKLSTLGDQQTTTCTMGVRTTNDVLSNLVTAMTPPAVKMAIGIRSAMVGIDEATGNSCMFTYDGLAQWNGSTQATFYDAGGSGTTRNFTQVVDNIGVAAVPHWAGNGALRPKVTGKLSTNIKWSCTAIFTVTRL